MNRKEKKYITIISVLKQTLKCLQSPSPNPVMGRDIPVGNESTAREIAETGGGDVLRVGDGTR